jgi:hypothetical protein
MFLFIDETSDFNEDTFPLIEDVLEFIDNTPDSTEDKSF